MSDGSDIAIWRRIAVPLITSRILMALGIFFAVAFTSAGGPYHSLTTMLDHMFSAWDAESYLSIARGGYSTQPDPRFVHDLVAGGYSLRLNHLDAFLPGYPLLVRMAAPLFGGDFVLGGLLVSFLAEGVALYYIYRLISRERDESAAGFATWGLALAPYAVFLGAVYTESTFIAAAAAAFYYMRGGEFRNASLAAAASCAVRITGAAVLLALLIEYVRRHGLRWHRDLLWLAIAPLPFVAYGLFMQWLTGDPLALLHVQGVYFSVHTAMPWSGLITTWNNVAGANAFVFFRELVFGIIGIVLCVIAWVYPRFPKSMAAYCGVVVGMAISISFWRSAPRYELALFPMAMIITDVAGRRREVLGALVGVSSVLMVWGTIIYVQGGWLG